MVASNRKRLKQERGVMVRVLAVSELTGENPSFG